MLGTGQSVAKEAVGFGQVGYELRPTEVTMVQRLLKADNDPATLIARVALGVVIFPHGAQKALGWFGGGGFRATMDGFANMDIPAPLAFLAILAEFAGSIGLVLGMLTRIAAFGVLCNMVVAAVLVSAPHGFFMNWYGDQKGEGFEFHILAVGLALVAIIRGGGALSLDRLIWGTPVGAPRVTPPSAQEPP